MPLQPSQRPITAQRASAGDPERLYLEQLPEIDRILAAVVKRHAVEREDAEEFMAWARAKLIDQDYLIVRKFEGRSSLRTYLTVVLGNLFRDYRNSAWGRWRPSANAQRLGPIAIRLEELLYRDGASLREACETLRAAGVSSSDRELSQLAAQLPQRTPHTELSFDQIEPAAPPVADAIATAGERAALAAALHDAVGGLNDEERVILRMRFWDGVSIADIARSLRIEQKPLYRRLEGMHQQLRQSLERRGITREIALDVITEVPLW